MTLLAVSEFKNEPFTDFSIASNEIAMKEALARVKAQFGKRYPLIIGGKRIETGNEWIVSTNPSVPKEVIGMFAKANCDHAELAMQAAIQTFTEWKKTPATERAKYLFKAADLMRKRKFDLVAWIIYEIGKNWAEADGDVAEAIDFCEFYGREMLRLSDPGPLHPYPNETNLLIYIPLGVGVVIPPWNFPLAILAGMSCAAIVAGNTIVLKPSSETPAIAHQFAQIMEEAGLPPGVINLVTGPGASVGDYLIVHPRTRFIAFTGSKEVGLRVTELANKPQAGQIWIKRVVAEMGGKNTIIVDSDADLNAAADGIVTSAFGYQGQKCSACSRAVVHKDVYDSLLQKLIERTKKLVIGNPEELKNKFGPVSSKSAHQSICKYIEIGEKEGKIVTGGSAQVPSFGFYIEPTIIADVDPQARIAQEEIFGPVLAVIKAQSWEQMLDIANNTEFGLTGGVYSGNRAHLKQAADEFHVGNLYFNRKCTGALVGVQPFGGFNMSGTDSKAGGRDYMLLFTQAKIVSDRHK